MKTQLTIADYINRHRTTVNTLIKNGSLQSNLQHIETFTNILSAVQKNQNPQPSLKRPAPDNGGRTLQDYIKKPVQRHFATANLSEDGRKGPNSGSSAKTASGQTEKATDLERSIAVLKNNIPHEKIENEPDIRQKIDTCIADASQKYNVPGELIRGIIMAESGFQPHVVSSAGAQGLMQLMPGTAEELGVTDPFDIKENIEGGVRYFKQMLDQFEGDVKLSLAAYNAGPGTVRRYNGVPPYKETRQYVGKVIKFSKETV